MPANETSTEIGVVTRMVYFNAFQVPLMLSAVNVGLPHFARDLSMTAVMLSWVPTAYLMASVMFVLIFGRLADRLGRKRIYLSGTATVFVASILAAVSQSGEQLLVMRYLQGIGVGMIYSTQIALLTSVYPPQQRGKVIGKMISIIYLGLTCGPLLGGYVVDLLGWRALLVFQLPLALVVLWQGAFRVEHEWKADHDEPFDVQGSVIYAGSIAAICAGASFVSQPVAQAVLVLGLMGLGLFVVVEKRTEFPLFDMGLFSSNRTFTLSCMASYIMYTATFANIVLVSLYLQYLKGYTASYAGLIMMVQPLTMAVFSPFAGHLSDRVEPRVITTTGMVITLSGLLLLSRLDADSELLFIILSLACTGVGFGVFSSPNTNAIMGSVEKRHYGLAAASNATMRLIGQMSSMLLVSLMTALYIGAVQISPEIYPQLQALTSTTFLIAAGLCIPGLFLSMARGHIHK